jgi:hypothetical protein
MIDHFVFAAATLDAGVRWLEDQIGVPLSPGGQHLAMGTHNRVLRLGADAYLEVIAVDPSLAPPSRPRWFSLDEPWMRAQLEQGPQIITWVARCDRLLEASAAYPAFGTVTKMSRGSYAWEITIPEDGALVENGILPSLIRWRDGTSPAGTLPDRGVRLEEFRLYHPAPQHVAEALRLAGFDPAFAARHIVAGDVARIEVSLAGPRGNVDFTSRASKLHGQPAMPQRAAPHEAARREMGEA